MGTTTDPPCFPLDYASSRREFREACARLGCALEAHPMNQAGPNGDDLTIDVAILPGGSPDRTLLVSSGIHGVEGFFGAAVQLRALQDWASRPGRKHAGVRCVMVHALNPFGFAWRRRVNEDNVDLNRNLLLPGESFSGSPAGYAALEGLLNPRHVPSRWEPVRLEFMVAIARHGMPAIKQSVASGQYDFPHGLFYGGGQPSRTSEILSEHFDRWLADSQRMLSDGRHEVTDSGARQPRLPSPRSLSQRETPSSLRRFLQGAVGFTPTARTIDRPLFTMGGVHTGRVRRQLLRAQAMNSVPE